MSWIRTAKAGDKVVRVPCEGPWDVQGVGVVADENGFPVIGRIYTIRRILLSCTGDVCISLDEIDTHPLFPSNARPAFSWRAFKPVDSRPTDISVFTDMLKPVDTRVPETA